MWDEQKSPQVLLVQGGRRIRESVQHSESVGLPTWMDSLADVPHTAVGAQAIASSPGAWLSRWSEMALPSSGWGYAAGSTARNVVA